jgi:intracellular septation protein
MKILLDLFPVIVFFIVYKTYGLNLAIIAMTFATILQILYTRFTTGKVEKMQIITLGLLIVFGGLTVWINNPAFIMWKVSVLYVVFALALIVSLWTKTTLLEKMLGKEIDIPSQVWRKITTFWAFGFVGIAIINAYFTNLALKASELFFSTTGLKKTELIELDCLKTTAIQLCQSAKLTEENWVDFKLFGTMGLTILLIVITVVIISKYKKD